MVWHHLRKSEIRNPMIPKLEDLLSQAVANLSSASALKTITKSQPSQANVTVPVRSETQRPNGPAEKSVHASFLQADPLMLRNGFYLSRPMRRPAQGYINVAVQENVQGIEGERFAKAEEKETQRLKTAFANGVRKLLR